MSDSLCRNQSAADSRPPIRDKMAENWKNADNTGVATAG
jgi:hypothetical protein